MSHFTLCDSRQGLLLPPGPGQRPGEHFLVRGHRVASFDRRDRVRVGWCCVEDCTLLLDRGRADQLRQRGHCEHLVESGHREDPPIGVGYHRAERVVHPLPADTA